MKILIAHNFYRSQMVGGEDRVVRQEVAALKQYLGEHNVFTYFVYNDDLSKFALCRNIWGDQTHANNIQAIIKNHHINILHVHNYFPLLTPSIFKAAKQLGCKVVQTLHNYRAVCLSGDLYRNQSICERCVKKTFKWPGIWHRCYRKSLLQSGLSGLAYAWYAVKKYQFDIDRFIVLTKDQQQRCQQFGIPSKKIWLKPNFVSVGAPPPSRAHRQGYVAIGRLEAGKGMVALLQLWQQLPKQFVLKVISGGDDEQLVKQHFSQDNITFLGKLSHADTLTTIAQSRYLIHPARYYETFGLTTIEAMQLAVPVIGLNIGTRVEMIRHEVNGFLCEPQDLLKTIRRSKDYQDYDALCDNALHDSKKFRPDIIIKQQIKYYQSLC